MADERITDYGEALVNAAQRIEFEAARQRQYLNEHGDSPEVAGRSSGLDTAAHILREEYERARGGTSQWRTCVIGSGMRVHMGNDVTIFNASGHTLLVRTQNVARTEVQP